MCNLSSCDSIVSRVCRSRWANNICEILARKIRIRFDKNLLHLSALSSILWSSLSQIVCHAFFSAWYSIGMATFGTSRRTVALDCTHYCSMLFRVPQPQHVNTQTKSKADGLWRARCIRPSTSNLPALYTAFSFKGCSSALSYFRNRVHK